jgi:preprotein translocase subunit SecE
MAKIAAGAARMDKEDKPTPGLGWLTEKWTGMREFYIETRLEMKRVTWPSRKQVQSTTIVVVVTVFFFGAFFLVTDTVVGKLIDMVFKRLTHA